MFGYRKVLISASAVGRNLSVNDAGRRWI